jgi:hypothetical protein
LSGLIVVAEPEVAGVVAVAGVEVSSSVSALSVGVVVAELLSWTNTARVGETVGAPDRRLLAMMSASSDAASSGVKAGAGAVAGAAAAVGTAAAAAVAVSTDERTVEAEEERVVPGVREGTDPDVEIEEFLVESSPPLGGAAGRDSSELALGGFDR